MKPQFNIVHLKQSLLSIALSAGLLALSPIAVADNLPTFTQSASQSSDLTQTVFETNTQPVTVYFINGIFSTEIQAQYSAIALFNRLKDNPTFAGMVGNQQISLGVLYNPTDPLLDDLYELDAQAQIQRIAIQATEARINSEGLNLLYDAEDLQQVRAVIFNEEMHRANQAFQAKAYNDLKLIEMAGSRVIDHYAKMAEEVKRTILSGEKVVLVAHSQGNYVAQGLYANLSQDPEIKDVLADNLQVVGVANVAGSTPSNLYLSNEADTAVYFLHVVQGGKPMPANFTAQFANGQPLGGLFESKAQRQNDGQNHGFIETYLSARFDEKTEFTPHSPEIIEKDSKDGQSQPIPIYRNIVNQVMAGIERMMG